MMYIGTFSCETVFRGGDRVVAVTDRGTEIGEVVSVFENVVSSQQVESGQVPAPESPPAGVQAPSSPQDGPGRPRVLRKATKEDLAKALEIRENMEPAQFRFCQQKIRELALPMRLAAVERLFGGEKIIFYFVADSRVDFRVLVRELAREYRTRIEMKQIGARDEAKLLGDFEHCGRELCCRRFIRALEPVTIKMAKNQKATLDPSKISGACGRLMCCLRFENPMYQELKKNLPSKGMKVKTPKGEGEVLNYDIIAQTALVEVPGGEKVAFGIREICWDSAQPAAARENGEEPEDARKIPPGEGNA